MCVCVCVCLYAAPHANVTGHHQQHAARVGSSPAHTLVGRRAFSAAATEITAGCCTPVYVAPPLAQVQCLSLALRAPTPRALRHWACHATASALAGGAYVLEDQLADEAAGRVAPGMHAAWHVLGALAVLTVQPFVLVVDAGVEAASASGGLVRLPLAA